VLLFFFNFVFFSALNQSAAGVSCFCKSLSGSEKKKGQKKKQLDASSSLVVFFFLFVCLVFFEK